MSAFLLKNPLSTSTKSAILFGILSALFAFNLGIITYSQSSQSLDGLAIDIAGRQRMLSQRIGFYSSQVARGNLEAKDELSSAISLHHNSLSILKLGGDTSTIEFYDKKPLPSANPTTTALIEDAESVWVDYKTHAEAVLTYDKSSQYSQAKITKSLEFLEKNNSLMLEKNNLVVAALVTDNENKQQAFNRIMIFLLFLDVFGISISFLITHNQVAKLQYLAQAANRITATGKLDTSIDINSDDEIGQVATAINSMISKINSSQLDLEELVDQRTLDLQSKVTDMNKLLKSITNRELKMVELKKKLKDSEKKK
jgi:nitrate/nitrite-specific signal transduction histidine kinase